MCSSDLITILEQYVIAVVEVVVEFVVRLKSEINEVVGSFGLNTEIIFLTGACKYNIIGTLLAASIKKYGAFQRFDGIGNVSHGFIGNGDPITGFWFFRA